MTEKRAAGRVPAVRRWCRYWGAPSLLLCGGLLLLISVLWSGVGRMSPVSGRRDRVPAGTYAMVQGYLPGREGCRAPGGAEAGEALSCRE